MAEKQLFLTRAYAAQIVEVVAKDPACKRLIPDSYFMGDFGYAGSIRNILNEPDIFIDPNHMPSAKSSEEACYYGDSLLNPQLRVNWSIWKKAS